MATIRKEDIQDIISDIRNMLSLRNDPAEADLQRLVQKYVTVVQQVNIMLKRCLELVEKGLSSEAIMRADETSLLELVAILDFPEEQIWVEFQNQFGFETPPVVDQFASRQINGCYAPAQLLEPLYRQNRRHALASSPLGVRLDVMRKIRGQEVGNARELATRQITLFETERLKQIRQELENAATGHDYSTLKMLSTELRKKDWLVAPPASLVTDATSAWRQEAAGRARHHMVDLAVKLQDKWSAQDAQGARNVRARWNDCMKMAKLPANHALMEETQAAFRWLEDIDTQERRSQEYQHLLVELTEKLDHRAGKEALEPLEHALDNFDEGIPRAVSHRLHTRYTEIETEDNRKYVRRLVLTVVGVLGAVALCAMGLRYRNFGTRLEKHQTSLAVLLERNDIEAARTYATTLQHEQPDMLQVPEISVLLLDVDQAEENEAKRREVFTDAVAATTERTGDAKTLADVRSLAEQINALPSRGDAEAQIVEQLFENVESKKTQIQDQVDRAFTTAFERAAYELKTYEENDVQQIDRIDKFRDQFDELSKMPDVSEELISGANGPLALVARCETRLRGMRNDEKRQQMLHAISLSVGSVTNFKTAMAAYVDAFPKTDRLALRFEALLRTQADSWQQVEQLNEFVQEHSIDCVALTPTEARKYVDEATVFLTAKPQFQHADELNKICDYLRFVGSRVDEDGEAMHMGIKDQLDNANLNDLYMVLLKTGQRHYTNLEPDYREVAGRVMYYPLPDWLDLQRQRDTEIQNLAQSRIDIWRRDGKADWEAPESALIRDIEQNLAEIDQFDWERVMLQTLERVYAERRPDPIFRLFMLRTILETAVSGSQVISEHYARSLKKLKDEPLNNINPFDPYDEATNLKRKYAVELLRPLASPATVLPQIQPHRDAVRKLRIGGQYRWIGWLNRDIAGWTCMSDKPLGANTNGSLAVFTRSTRDTPRFVKIGNVQDGSATMTPSSSHVSEGQPVYFYEE